MYVREWGEKVDDQRDLEEGKEQNGLWGEEVCFSETRGKCVCIWSVWDVHMWLAWMELTPSLCGRPGLVLREEGPTDCPLALLRRLGLNQVKEGDESVWERAESSPTISSTVGLLLCSWTQEVKWETCSSLAKSMDLVSNPLCEIKFDREFPQSKTGQRHHNLNYHGYIWGTKILLLFLCALAKWHPGPRAWAHVLTWLLQENEPMGDNRVAHFSLPHWSLHLESREGDLFGSCHNQSWLPTVLCILCQAVCKDGDFPQGIQVAGHLLWSGMLRTPGGYHFLIISMLASFAGQIIRPAGGFSLAAVLRKGFLL